VLSDRRVGETLKQMSRPSDQRLTREVAREICLRTNSAVLVAGSIAQVGDGYSLALKASSCGTEAVLASVEAEAANRNSVLAALHRADGQLRRQLGESLASLQKFNSPLAEATTSSLEALKLYSDGLKERQAKGSLEGIPYLQRAIEIDPTFAQAYASLGTIYANTSQWGPARDSYSRAYELRGRVNERERFLIEFLYLQYVSGESDKTIQVCRQWILSYPGDSYPHTMLGLIQLYSGQFEKAAQEFREALRLGTDTPYSNLMAASRMRVSLNGRQSWRPHRLTRKKERQNTTQALLGGKPRLGTSTEPADMRMRPWPPVMLPPYERESPWPWREPERSATLKGSPNN